MPVFTFDHVPNNSGYNHINAQAQQAQQNTEGSSTFTLAEFREKFKKKKDAHYYFEKIMQKLLDDVKEYNLQHYMLFFTGKVQLVSISDITIADIKHLDGVTDQITVFN